jgi:hypothetical protein
MWADKCLCWWASLRMMVGRYNYERAPAWASPVLDSPPERGGRAAALIVCVATMC